MRRPDGALLLGIPNLNGANENLPPGAEFVAAFAFSAVPHAVETRTGALVRLGKHVGADGWVTGLSVGQCLSAIRAEARELGLQPVFARVTTVPENESVSPAMRVAEIVGYALCYLMVGVTVIFLIAMATGG